MGERIDVLIADAAADGLGIRRAPWWSVGDFVIPAQTGDRTDEGWGSRAAPVGAPYCPTL